MAETLDTITTHEDKREKNELVLNYLNQRKILGLIGVSIPILLLVLSVPFNNSHIEGAISDYFHTPLRDVFVVGICGISIFLFAYKGYDPLDRFITNSAGFFGILTAFIPTTFKASGTTISHVLAIRDHFHPEKIQLFPLDKLNGGQLEIIPNPISPLQGAIHIICAALFFLLLAWMAYFQFSKSGSKREKRLYKICGIIIVITIALMSLNLIGSSDFDRIFVEYRLTFVGEAICMWSFGLSWFVKGGVFSKQL